MISKSERQCVSAGVVETIQKLRDGLHSEDDHGYELYKWLEKNQDQIVDAACERVELSRAMLGQT